jgi:hypothetical protein
MKSMSAKYLHSLNQLIESATESRLINIGRDEKSIHASLCLVQEKQHFEKRVRWKEWLSNETYTL